MGNQALLPPSLLHYCHHFLTSLQSQSVWVLSGKLTSFSHRDFFLASVAALALMVVADVAAGRPADFTAQCGMTESGGCLAACKHGDSKAPLLSCASEKREVREDVLAEGSELNCPCHWLSKRKTRHKRERTHTHTSLTESWDGPVEWPDDAQISLLS